MVDVGIDGLMPDESDCQAGSAHGPVGRRRREPWALGLLLAGALLFVGLTAMLLVGLPGVRLPSSSLPWVGAQERLVDAATAADRAAHAVTTAAMRWTGAD